ncbi:MAG: AraC family transcriptional regulator ligand-binding domain-containing protein [Spongiibacteraceae bacterium]
MRRSEKHTEEAEYITLGYMRPLLNYVESCGKPIEELIDILGLRAADLSCSDLRLAGSAINTVFDRAAELCGNDNIGLDASMQMNLTHIGILGHLIMSCTRGEQVLDLHSRYQTLIGNGARSDYDFSVEEGVCLRFKRVDGGIPYGRHFHEFNLGGWMSLVKLVTGQALKPERIQFPFTRPKDISAQQKFFNCELVYGGCSDEGMRVYFSPDHLDRFLYAADSSLKDSLELAARRRLDELQGSYGEAADTLQTQLLSFIRRELIHGAPSIEQAAERLNTSVRTLQRQLDGVGVNYKALVDDARRELGGRYIVNEELSLVDVALMLGYAEQSSFQRAFKRWYDDTPGEYRRQASA